MRKLVVAHTVLVVLIGTLLWLTAASSLGNPRGRAAGNSIPHKRALLVGISNYCPKDAVGNECSNGGKYWWDLNSAADVEALKVSLMTKFGFQESEIKVLTSKAETTRNNITETFRSFLIEPTNPGDIVYFHYSGHGGQLPDDNLHGPNPTIGDELDGLDECLIPSDYALGPDGNWRQRDSNFIRDDEVGQWLGALKEKHPGSVTITMDSCFSGSNTRGGEHLMRGAAWNGIVPTVDKSNARVKSVSGLLAQGEAAQMGCVVISATNDRQGAGETRCGGTEMGLLTCALVKALSDAGENTTYRDIFEKVNYQVVHNASNQNPQLEGDRDQRILNLGASPPQPYVTLDTLGNQIVLNAGRLQGMTVGSQFDVHPRSADPKDTTSFAHAEIVRVYLATSLLSVTSPAGPPKTDDLRLARAVETLHNFGDQRLRVADNDLAHKSKGQAVLTMVSGMRVVNAVMKPGDVPQVRICRGRCQNEIDRGGLSQNQEEMSNGFTLLREDGSVLRRVPDGGNQLEQIRLALEAEARWRYVKEVISNSDREINLKFRLVPVERIENLDCDPKSDPNCNPTRDKVIPKITEGGKLLLHGGDLVQLEFLNTGVLPVHVTVLDLRNDGTIAAVWPHPCVPLGSADENLISVRTDGKWQRLPWQFTIEITPPFGPEVFKVIATRDPADFSPLIDSRTADSIVRGDATRGTRGASEAKTEIGQLLLSATRPKQMRGNSPFINLASVSVHPMNWATTEITFEAQQGEKTEFARSDCH